MNPILKKLIRDYNYLNETLDDVKEISSVAEGEFRNALLESDPIAAEALRPKTQEVNIEDINIEIEESIFENHNDIKFKKLFRKIAVKCHPDKLGNVTKNEAKFLKKIYEDLNIANQNHDWGLLLKIAMELDIEFNDLTDSEFENISKNIQILQSEIQKYENSMAYSWYIKNDENSKKEYLAICANIFKKSLEN
jgi:hypothetical protein